MERKSSALIVEALSLLELVLEHSASNFHAKLLLIKLYHILGEILVVYSTSHSDTIGYIYFL